MICVIVAENEQDKSFTQRLCAVMENNFSIMGVCGRELRACDESAELLITDIDSFEHIKADKQIIIFKGISKIDIEKVTSGEAIAIVDSCNGELLNFVSFTKLPAITCGLSPKDSITLSSIGTHSAVITLQRSITCFDGTVAEPQEIPVKLAMPEDSFMLMAVASIFILSGKIDRLLQIRL